ncbi:Uncharacterised protein [Vibrio cholerae]|nr:Uncharacterised protein [Vibrio cholerae]
MLAISNSGAPHGRSFCFLSSIFWEHALNFPVQAD